MALYSRFAVGTQRRLRCTTMFWPRGPTAGVLAEGSLGLSRLATALRMAICGICVRAARSGLCGRFWAWWLAGGGSSARGVDTRFSVANCRCAQHSRFAREKAVQAVPAGAGEKYRFPFPFWGARFWKRRIKPRSGTAQWHIGRARAPGGRFASVFHWEIHPFGGAGVSTRSS